MPTASVNGIDVYYERGGEGRPAAVPQRVGIDARHQRDRDRAVPRALRPRRPRPAGPRPHLDPARARTRWPTTRPTRRGCSTRSAGTAAGSWASASAGWSPRSWRSPGPSGSSAWPCCAPRPAVRAGRRTRCTSWPIWTSRPAGGAGCRAARHPVHRRVAGHPRVRPDARRDDGRAGLDAAHRRGAPGRARAAAGAPPPRRVGPARPHHLPDPRGRRSLRRHRARRRTPRASPAASRAPSCASTRVVTPSSARTRPRSRRCWTSSTR